MSERLFCSCCLGEQCNKNMDNVYVYENRKEVYGEMILNTLGIDIQTPDKQKECFICDDCVTKLRDASSFKDLVLATQKTIKKGIEIIEKDSNIEFDDEVSCDKGIEIIEKDSNIEFDDEVSCNKGIEIIENDSNIEFDDEVSCDLEDSRFDWDDKDDSQNGDIFVIKLKPKEVILDEIPSNHHIVYKDSSRDSLSEENSSVIIIDETESVEPIAVTDLTVQSDRPKTVNTFNIASWQKERAINKNVETEIVKKNPNQKQIVEFKEKVTETATATPKKRCPKKKRPSTKMAINARENTINLILNSNLCLFRSLKTKFACILCNTIFVDPLELRKHFSTHENDNSTTILLKRIKKMRGVSCKNAEITDLKCKICSENISDLTELLTHLKGQHDVEFYGTDTLLIPYKLVRGNQCVLCEANFNSFLRLSIHMNYHYPHHVCEVCGFWFISRLRLSAHMLSMHREKKCPHCPAKFFTISSKAKHLRKDHKIIYRKTYCNLCEKVFPYTYQLNLHKVEEHGARKLEVNCHICGKLYRSEANLRAHLRAVHIQERRYPCQVCGTRFFTKADQMRHEKTHNDLRLFYCNYCNRKFKYKHSCKKHIQKLHGDMFK